MKKRVTWNKYDALALCFSLALVVFFGAREVMPYVEGRLFPVIEPATLESFTPQPPPAWRARWVASAKKNRECGYILGSISWSFGETGGANQQVFARFDDKPAVRGVGILRWDSLVVDLDPSIVLDQSFATVRHQCAWRWWQTESIFYLPKNP